MSRAAQSNDKDCNGAPVPRVRVIVVNYNGGAHLARCVAALRRQTFRDFEVVIADNSSTDGSIAAVRTEGSCIRILEFGENLGFAAANNRAAAGAETDWIATLNPDAFPEPDWLETLIAAADAFPDTAMFGSTQISDADPSLYDGTGDAYFFAGFPWRGAYGQPLRDLPDFAETFSPCGAAALWRRDAFDAAGGFDERFFCYCEDVDLAFRLRARGGRCIQVSHARVRHVGSATVGARSDFAVFHGARNRIWTLVKNTPLPLLVLAAPVHVFGLAFMAVKSVGRRGGWQETKAVMRGVGAALAGLGPVLADRRRLVRARQTTWWRLAQAMSWSPVTYLRRTADLRPAAKT